MAYIFTNPKYTKDYQQNQNNGVQVTMNGHTRILPMDSSNDMYVALMEQVDAGNLTIAEADPEPTGHA